MGKLAGELCDLCSGVLKAAIVDMEFVRDGQRIVCEDIPADVCVQCGERYISADTMIRIERLLSRPRQVQPRRQIMVPVYAFESAI